ncbi:hypothetical protein F5B20DRAFT_442058 [Whalleya microplaca]|nr:hypothetical protein F5B20DRAFT_442058 [Whalleya microplaca]
MTTRLPSPKRRHILSSINPDRRSASPIMEAHHTTPEAMPEESLDTEKATATEAPEPTGRKTTRFRFKSKDSRSHRSSRHRDSRDDEPSDPTPPNEQRKHRHHHHRHRHHRHKRRRTRSRSPTPPNPYDPTPLDPDAAFRASLFDAMADDEGAAYWEGVYGQPMHVYARSQPQAGELESMTDEEYAAHVRQKMWEKTHEGLLEERARRDERRRQKEREADEAKRLTREMEESLRRGEVRRRKRSFRERWEAYVEAWGKWDGGVEGLAWPVASGRRKDVSADAVRDFFVMGVDPLEVGEAEFVARLKEERVRWHPDKIQQRLGGKVDEAVMRDVTAVFQIVDKLWSDTRAKA